MIDLKWHVDRYTSEDGREVRRRVLSELGTTRAEIWEGRGGTHSISVTCELLEKEDSN